MQVIDQINGSALFAQSAYSAAVATNDSLGRNISETYLTEHQSLDGYATETLVEETSGAITSLIPTDYYPDTNPSGFISGVDLSDYATTADLALKQDTITFGYDGQDKISAINNSAIAGVGSLDIVPISGTGAVNVYEENNVLWVSGKDFTSDISYISGVVGDVETLLASL